VLVPSGFVFSDDPDGGRPWKPACLSAAFRGIREKAGVETKVRLHDLRHFGATQLLAAGMPVTAVADRLGHTDVAITLRVYARGTAEEDARVARIMGETLSS